MNSKMTDINTKHDKNQAIYGTKSDSIIFI